MIQELVEDDFTTREVPEFGLAEDDYARALDHLVQANVDVIVHTGDGRVLLGHREDLPLRNMFWVFGGRMKVGETLVDSGVRALRRELDLHADPDRLLLSRTYNVRWGTRSVAPEERGFQTLLTLMTYRCTDEEARRLAPADRTHGWVRWHSRQELRELARNGSRLLHPFLPIVLRDAGLF
ncbi:NUDIX hydrolase [Micromonospora okii]|uniref:NUDIX hydrolase n=1 Tax=Micromonospora okii TaxID=1182970 RepID=UPI001E64F6C4|nr:NUDIX domain-containing protein [Micromonospora okii]